jgi:hypothetical protein
MEEKKTDPEEVKKSTEALINKAIEGKHSEKEILGSFAELSVARTVKKATLKIADGFAQAADESYKSYLTNLENNIDDLRLILNHLTYRKCAEFYYKEADIVADEMDEYINYVFFSGHFFNTVIMGWPRPSEDYFDSRYGFPGGRNE